MACVALASLMATIQLEFRRPIPRVPRHDQRPINSLIKSLSSLQSFLEKPNNNGGIRDLEIEIRDFAIEAEDAIEIQLSNFLLAKDTECEHKAFQELHQILREAAEKAAELFNILNTTTITNESIRKDFESENFELDGSLCHPPRLDNKTVGRDNDHARIKNQLDDIEMTFPWLEADKKAQLTKLKMIWIVGMPGIGKTTLATSVYEDPKMKQCFEVQVWITMPPKYNHREILCNLLLSIRAEKEPADEIRKRRTPELASQVRKHLMGTRFLIVLDNLWNSQAWDDIKKCFPDNENASRILLTTTHFRRSSYATSSYYIHNLTLLDPNNSWDIFCNILSLEEHMAPIFEKIRSREIVGKCDGLPQLIVAVAKRLSTCNNIRQEGKRIEKELDSIGILDRTALTFVFNQLPLHLKVCFLYLGVFPKRSEILVKILIGFWVAEGFVKSECKAYLYLQELIDRSLVLIGNWSCFDDKIKTCRIHSAWHSFCVGEAQREGILCTVNTRRHLGLPLNAFANSCRWLSFYPHKFDYYVLFSTNYSRSIFFFDENPEMFAPSNLLRVLVFVSSPFLQRIPKHLGNLVFLRYLSITQWFEGLDDIVSANPNLQTLIISHGESQLGAPIRQLPSRIWEPSHLRHLELGNIYMVDPPNMVKENLQTLSWLIPIHCGKEALSRFPNIKKLKFFCRDHLEPNNTCILDILVYLERLEMLSVSGSVGHIVSCSRQLMFPSQLKKLKLSRTNLFVGDLMVIGMLPRLEVLKLENALHENVLEVAEGGFRKLRFLLLEDASLKEMMTNGDSFPRLERLILRSCYYLREIPSSFAYVGNLQSIELDMCRRSAVTSAKRIKLERDDWGDKMFKVKVLRREYEESHYIDDSLEDDFDWLTTN